MFEKRAPRTGLQSAFNILELIYVSAVRNVRSNHRHAVVGLLINIAQVAIMVMAFFLMFSVLGLRDSMIRGDFMLFLLSGIFLYMTHIKAVAAAMNSTAPTNPMLLHAPLNSMILIFASALSAIYIQLLSIIIILFIYHAAWQPIDIAYWPGAVGMFILAWFSGFCVGMVFLALKPWLPGLTPILQTFYIRANMIASGKMFLANALPGYMLAWFDWNPLFHIIDQARGYVFVNYFPHFSSWTYALNVSLVLLLLGLLGEFYARRNVSISMNAGR